MWVIKQRGIILRMLSTHKIISLLIVKNYNNYKQFLYKDKQDRH